MDIKEIYAQHIELLGKERALNQEKTNWSKEVALPKIKELLGQDLCLVPIEWKNLLNTFGKYGELEAFAFSKEGILMAHSNTQGWCDKPIQPYYANYYRYAALIAILKRDAYILIPNPIKTHNVVIVVG